MNVLLWVFQAMLALLSFAGGAYKVFMFEELAKVPTTGALSRAGWSALGVFEMLCAILLIIPAAIEWMPVLTPLAAAALALESLALATLYAQYSHTPAHSVSTPSGVLITRYVRSGEVRTGTFEEVE